MCGIVGYHGDPELARRSVERMTESLAHRGPDASGFHADGPLALGHRRLAILDLAETGAQPMATADGRLVGVLNGEIYNFPELRRRLERDGGRLRGTSDTEVLLECLARYGVEVVPQLRGMFAFAVWDRERRRLLLARDHLGKKPLYLWQGSGGRFAFASEARALRRVLDLSLDPGVLASYFTFGYVPEPVTAYAGVSTLPPATYATWSAEEGLDATTYWRPRELLAPAAASPDLDELDELLSRAVARRLASDVPVGAFLSGGVDSALIASYVAQHAPGTVAITVGFDRAAWDESGDAARTAALMDVEHVVERVSVPDAEAMLDEYADCFDLPFADSSGVPTLALARATRRHVTVALGGDGGDEVFCGYSRYDWLERARRARRRLGPLRHAAAGLAALLPRRGARMAGMLAAGSAGDVYRILSTVWHHGPVDALVGGPPGAAAAWFDGRFGADGANPLAQAQLFDLENELPFDILVKVDRASMWHSLETRSPLLDVDVVEWALRGGLVGDRRQLGKTLLKDLVVRRLPGFRPDRPKRGFALPVEPWLRGPLRERLRAAADPARLAADGLLDARAVGDTLRRFEAGAPELASGLWALLVFQEWRRRHADGGGGS